MHRSRIRVTLLAQNGTVPQPADLHEHSFHCPIEPTDAPTHSLNELDSKKYKSNRMIMVPYLALNEVAYNRIVFILRAMMYSVNI